MGNFLETQLFHQVHSIDMVEVLRWFTYTHQGMASVFVLNKYQTEMRRQGSSGGLRASAVKFESLQT